MTPEEIEKLLESTEWKELGKGNYNQVYCSIKPLTIDGFTGRWVLKIPKDAEGLSDRTRAVRKWKGINPEYPAFVIRKPAWIAPYLGEKTASDEQIAARVIEIYQRTGNIIGDAGAGNGSNFLVFGNDVVCIDVDHAFQRYSMDSDSYFFLSHVYDPNTKMPKPYIESDYIPFLDRCDELGFSKTANVIKTLLYLSNFLEDNGIQEEDVNQNLINKLRLFRKAKIPLTTHKQQIFLDIAKADPQGEISYKYFTNELIEEIEAKADFVITQESLCQLIYERLTKRQTINDIFNSGNLADVKILIKYNKNLLTQTNNKGELPLHQAIQYGHRKMAAYLISECLDEHGKMDSVYKPEDAIRHALTYGCDEIVQQLLEASDVSMECFSDYEQLKFAARIGNLAKVKMLIAKDLQLIEAVDSYNQTALIWAASRGHVDVVDFLISMAANLDAATEIPEDSTSQDNHNFTALDWAISRGHSAVVALLMAKGAKANHLHNKVKGLSFVELIEANDLGAIKSLILHNKALANKPINGIYPLFYASNLQKIEIINYLAGMGAYLDALNPGGMTVLSFALTNKLDDAVIMSLLEKGANIPPAIVDQTHPIHIAARNGNLPLVIKMVNAYPELLNATTIFKETPLIFAAARGYFEIVQFLIGKGADLNFATILPKDHPSQREHNRTALDWAIYKGHRSIVGLLKEKNANSNYFKTSGLTFHSIFSSLANNKKDIAAPSTQAGLKPTT